MKVMCVDANIGGLGFMEGTPPVIVGNIYEVIQVTQPRQFGYTGPLADKDFFILKETGFRNCYLADMFSPVAGPDENEIEEERKEKEGIALDLTLDKLIERIEYA